VAGRGSELLELSPSLALARIDVIPMGRRAFERDPGVPPDALPA